MTATIPPLTLTAITDEQLARIEDRIAGIETTIRDLVPVLDLWLTAEQTCEVLGVSVDTLTRWERDGELVPTRIGKVVRWSRRDIYDCMQSHKAVST